MSMTDIGNIPTVNRIVSDNVALHNVDFNHDSILRAFRKIKTNESIGPDNLPPGIFQSVGKKVTYWQSFRSIKYVREFTKKETVLLAYKSGCLLKYRIIVPYFNLCGMQGYGTSNCIKYAAILTRYPHYYSQATWLFTPLLWSRNGVCQQTVCSLVCPEMKCKPQLLKTFRGPWLALITTAQNSNTYACSQGTFSCKFSSKSSTSLTFIFKFKNSNRINWQLHNGIKPSGL